MKNKITTKSKIAIILLLLLVSIGGYVGYRSYANSNAPTDGINYDPPTEEEKQAGDEQKEEIIKDEEAEEKQTNNEQKQTASVIITDAGQYDDVIEVRSFIPDHYQDGTCTITFRQGEKTLSKDTPAYKDASTTICTNPLFKRSEFPSGGDWQVTVSYTSKDAAGQSKPQTVTLK